MAAISDRPSNLRLGPYCEESGGWPVFRGETHVATFSKEAAARAYVRPAVETTETLRHFAECAAGASCDDEYAPRMVQHIAENARFVLDGLPLKAPAEPNIPTCPRCDVEHWPHCPAVKTAAKPDDTPDHLLKQGYRSGSAAGPRTPKP